MALNTDYRIRIVFLFEHYFILNKDTRVYERAFIYQKHRNHKCEVITTGFYTFRKRVIYFCIGSRFRVVEHFRQQFDNDVCVVVSATTAFSHDFPILLHLSR